MNKLVKLLISMTLTVTFLLSITVTIPLTYAIGAKLYVDPSAYTATWENEVFDLNITIEGIEEGMELIGVEFKLGFNATLLKALNVAEGSFFAGFAGDPNQGTIISYSIQDDHVLCAVVIMPDQYGVYHAPFPSGSGTIATITFKATYQPVEPDLLASCDLVLYDTKLVDTTGEPPGIPHDTEDGYYEIPPTPPRPTFEVTPENTSVSIKGEEFSVDIDVWNLNADFEAIGFEFKLGFDATLLEVVNVAEGSFFAGFAGDPNQGTFFTYAIKDDYVQCAVVIMPDENAVYHAPFPSGSGTIATITFKSIYLPVEPDLLASCDLVLYDTKLVDTTGEPPGIPHDTNDGYYEILLIPSTLEVSPENNWVVCKCEEFCVDINVKNLDIRMGVIGIEFKLGFNATLLEVVNVTEGSFFAGFAGDPHQGTFFTYAIKDDYVVVAVVIMPDEYGVYHAPFANGNGTIATICFHAIYQPVEPNPLASCELLLFDTKMPDRAGNPPGAIHDVKSGYYEIEPIIPGDLNCDGIVDIFDLVRAAVAFGSTPSDPNWDSSADLNGDEIIDIFDLVMIALHFGESKP